MTVSKNDIAVFASPHPFSVERVERGFPAGASVAKIVDQCQPEALLRRHAHVYIDGHYVPQESWARVKPRAGTTLSIRMAPMGSGGGGKNPLRTILSLAIMAVSPVLAGSLAGAFGLSAGGSLLGRVITGGVGLLGRLALNALAPPARPRFSGGRESQTLFIQGARNQPSPFGRVPRVLGKHRMVPPLGALPFTETVGDDQYLRMLFIWGYGPLHISDLKIGETPLSEFTDVEVETRQGYVTDAPITLYSNSVIQNDLQAMLKNAGGFVTRTTEEEADEISVDLTLPSGLFAFTPSGAKKVSSVQIEVQYSPKGAGQWSAGATAYSAIAAQNLTIAPRPSAHVLPAGALTVARIDRVVLDPASGVARVLRGTEVVLGLQDAAPQPPSVPSGMIALARLTRRSDDPAVIPSTHIVNERETALFGKAFQSSGDFSVTPSLSADQISVAAGGLKHAGIVVSATQSAAIRAQARFMVPRGQYDVRLRRLTADDTTGNVFDETVWTALRTVRHVAPVKMQGLAMTALRIKATNQLSGVIEKFNGVVHSILPDWNGTAWVAQPTSNPASLFRHVLQGSANARPLDDSRLDFGRLQAWHQHCASTEREFNAVIDYDVSVREVLQDVAAVGRASTVLIDGKWAVVEDRPQDVPVQHFTPRNTWGFQGSKSFGDMPHALRVRFINRDKGWLQDERLVFDDGYDESTATKYDALSLNGVTSADQAWKEGRYHIATARLRPETYSFFADIEHIVCTRGDLIRFTHDVPLFGLMSARVKSLSVSAGNVTAVTLDAQVTMEAGKNYALRFRVSDGTSLLQPLVAQTGTFDTVTFSTPCPISSGLQVGDLALFGESGQESVALVVRSVEPQGDFNARITCVDAAPNVHLAETGTIPAWSPQITVPLEMQRPPPPIVAGITSEDGRIFITLAPHSFTLPLIVEARTRTVGETSFHTARFGVSGNRLVISDMVAGARVDIAVTYKTSSGVSSVPTIIANYEVAGASGLPADVQNFGFNILGGTAHLSWDAVLGTNISGYRIKFNSASTGATWANSFALVSNVSPSSTSISVPARPGTWLIKAVDMAGRESASPAVVASSLDRIDGYVLQAQADETTSLSGFMSAGSSGVAYTGTGHLVLDGGLEGTYFFKEIIDVTDVYSGLLSARMSVLGVNDDNSVDDWGSVDLVPDWDGAEDPATWNVQLQVRTTRDDPFFSGAAWSEWRNFIVGEYIARGYQFRLKLSSTVEGITPEISAITVDLDMPVWTQAALDVVSNASDNVLGAGTRVSFPELFYDYSAVTVTAHDMQTGDYYVLAGQDFSGFSIAFRNASGARITRTFDYIAQGIGRKVSS